MLAAKGREVVNAVSRGCTILSPVAAVGVGGLCYLCGGSRDDGGGQTFSANPAIF